MYLLAADSTDVTATVVNALLNNEHKHMCKLGGGLHMPH